MKRFLAIALALVMIFAIAACAGGDTPADAPADEGIELALITDIGTIDDKSFNQGSWEGVKQYGDENGKSYKYYQPASQGDDAYLNAIDLAVQDGAKLIVTPGFLFETPIHTAQSRYPDVKFVLIDGTPHAGDYVPDIGDNTVGITYAEHESGFLAGYASVIEGYTKLGFLGGMAVPAVVRFGHGYVLGAEYAAEELGLPDGSIEMNYFYTGVFEPQPEIQTRAATWYQEGVEVIFVAGGGICFSVFEPAAQSNAFTIGVDVDQSGESPTVITSAMKQLKKSVYDQVAAFYAGSFPGGQHLVYTAANMGVGLPMESSKFNTFDQAQYDAIYAKLADGSYVVSNNSNPDDADNLGTKKVIVNYFR